VFLCYLHEAQLLSAVAVSEEKTIDVDAVKGCDRQERRQKSSVALFHLQRQRQEICSSCVGLVDKKFQIAFTSAAEFASPILYALTPATLIETTPTINTGGCSAA
jgi:hypothetical protein